MDTNTDNDLVNAVAEIVMDLYLERAASGDEACHCLTDPKVELLTAHVPGS